MAEFTHTEVDNYGGGGGSFFRLENHQDTALVRLLYTDINDVTGLSVHEIQLDGKRRLVNCLRSYNQPVADCPLCAAGMKIQAKVFVSMYNIDADEVQVWERGRTIFNILASLSARYAPLYTMPFEIERIGKRGDTSTRYEFYPTEVDEIAIEDLPEPMEVIGTIVLEKSFEDLQYYLDYGEFIEEEGQEAPAPERPARRTSAKPAPIRASQVKEQDDTPPPTTRRVPSRRNPF